MKPAQTAHICPRVSVAALLLLAAVARATPPPASNAPAQSLAVFGQKIVYYDLGTGPTLVLLHGLGSSARGDWGRCFDALAEHHRVLAPDQLGFGASDKPFINYSIQVWVDFLGEFLRKLQVKHFTLVGESLGGWVAALYTIEAETVAPPGPSFVLPAPSRLVLCDAGGHRQLAAAILQGAGPNGDTVAGAKELLEEIFYDPSWHSDEAVRADLAWAMGKGDAWTMTSLASNRDILGESVDDRLQSIRIPTLVIWGAEDRLVPLADGRDFAAKIPGAKLIVIPQCGHAACIEKPSAWLAAASPFLSVP